MRMWCWTRGDTSELVLSVVEVPALSSVEVKGMMKVGLLWFDDDPERAIRCGRVGVFATPKVLPHRFWLGVVDHSQGERETR